MPRKHKLFRWLWVSVAVLVCTAATLILLPGSPFRDGAQALAESLLLRARPSGIQDAEHWIDRLGAEHMHIPGNEWGLARRYPDVPAAALQRMGTSVVPIAIEVLRKNETYQKRMGAVKALEQFGSAAAPAIPELIQQIQNSDEKGQGWVIRDAAIATIRQTGPGIDEARRQLAAAVRDPAKPDDYHKRIWTAYALASIDPGNHSAVEVLTAGLTDERPDQSAQPAPAGWSVPPVRGEAIEALLFLASPYRPSESKLSSIDEPTAASLAAALLKIVQTDVRATKFDERQLALDVLRGMGPRARTAAPALRALLADANAAPLHPWVREALTAIDRPKGGGQ